MILLASSFLIPKINKFAAANERRLSEQIKNLEDYVFELDAHNSEKHHPVKIKNIADLAILDAKAANTVTDMKSSQRCNR